MFKTIRAIFNAPRKLESALARIAELEALVADIGIVTTDHQDRLDDFDPTEFVTDRQLEDALDELDVEDLEGRIQELERNSTDTEDFEERIADLEDLDAKVDDHHGRLNLIEQAGDDLVNRVFALERK